MLSQILQTLRDTQQPLCAETLAQTLHKDPEAVAAMLDELVLMGRVRVDTSESVCQACQLRSLCGLPMGSGPLYRLSEAG
jgi:hypothetical protein